MGKNLVLLAWLLIFCFTDGRGDDGTYLTRNPYMEEFEQARRSGSFKDPVRVRALFERLIHEDSFWSMAVLHYLLDIGFNSRRIFKFDQPYAKGPTPLIESTIPGEETARAKRAIESWVTRNLESNQGMGLMIVKEVILVESVPCSYQFALYLLSEFNIGGRELAPEYRNRVVICLLNFFEQVAKEVPSWWSERLENRGEGVARLEEIGIRLFMGLFRQLKHLPEIRREAALKNISELRRAGPFVHYLERTARERLEPFAPKGGCTSDVAKWEKKGEM